MNRCHMPSTADFNPDNRPPQTDTIPGILKQPTEDTITYIRNAARTIVDQSEAQSRTSLQGLDQVVTWFRERPDSAA